MPKKLKYSMAGRGMLYTAVSDNVVTEECKYDYITSLIKSRNYTA